jgi:polygalacturonase
MALRMTKHLFLALTIRVAGVFAAISVSAAPTNSIFEARSFGAHGDGKSLDTQALQAAIEAASQAGGGVVRLTPGTYLSGSLQLRSRVELRIEAGATLLGSASRADYQKGRWYALLLASHQQDVAISGSGTIDGQGRQLAQDIIRRIQAGEIHDAMTHNRPNENQRPLLIEFRDCQNVRVSGVMLRDSSCWVENYIQCDGLALENVRVHSTAYWNNDGLDITDCTRVRVTGCDINSADDGICLKSSSASNRCDDVEIADCRIRSSASALKFGTSSFGGFRNIRARNLTVYDTFRSAVALEAVDGAVLEHVRIENIQATNTGNAIFLRLGHRNATGPIGRLDDVVIRNVKVAVPAGKPDAGYETPGPVVKQPHNSFPASVVGLPGHPVSHVVLENIEITYAGGGTPERARVPLDALERVPEQAENYPEFSMFGELPAWGFYVRHAEGIEFRNCRLRLEQPDFRPALVADDVQGLRLEGVDFGPSSGEPVAVLDNVRDAEVGEVNFPEGAREKIRRVGGDRAVK